MSSIKSPSVQRTSNRVLSFSDLRLGRLLEKVEPKLELASITIGKNYQFAGDRSTVRQVIDVDGEYVLVKTNGNLLEPAYYAVHYSWLHPNDSPVWDDDNKLRKHHIS